MKKNRILRRSYGGIAVLIGFILSPLSWWNDLIVNIPLSYIFAFPFGLISKRLFVPMFILGYWLSNVLGFYLMHHGVKSVVSTDVKSKSVTKELMQNFAVSLLYTFLILLLLKLGIVRFPSEYLPKE